MRTKHARLIRQGIITARIEIRTGAHLARVEVIEAVTLIQAGMDTSNIPDNMLQLKAHKHVDLADAARSAYTVRRINQANLNAARGKPF